jgi:uncharacterized protein
MPHFDSVAKNDLPSEGRLDRRTFVKRSAAAVAAGAIGITGYTIGIEPHWLEIVERELPIALLPGELEGRTLAQVSDLHIGARVSDDYLIRSLDRLRALRPDLVVVTGDFISFDESREDALFRQVRGVLARLPKGVLATVGILGNHDYGRNWTDASVAAKVVAEAERAGVQMLRNDVRTVSGLDIVGVDDLWAYKSDSRRALARRAGAASLALCHNPDGLDELPWEGFSGWVLAGHTHGGQCKPPFLPPPLLPVKNRRYVSGEVAVDGGRTLYISRGVGHLIRARFNVRPEITLFTLRNRR